MTANQKTIAIIDYGMGNLRSVANALSYINCPGFITNNPEDLSQANHIILPGVGAFGDAMENLQSRGWVKALEAEVREKGKPFLGICLGMQLLATTGTEHGVHKGLDWIPGTVVRLQSSNAGNIRIPHIGWNDVNFTKPNKLFAGLNDSQIFYFVHSYVLVPNNQGVISGISHYGAEFVSSIELGNIYATQFHPEKSQKVGLEVLKNFVNLSICSKTA
ncbi:MULTISPECIES: imidazole glycerol phosphate synthase subunit HisH [Cyanophyceae]|uniref:imidazole glycerol phosphate synthase subunit HisH n=1 Tax=Cyanophyceae TaxID=3028117 RepID=UPI00168234FD|nr:imidazole glycerol phosphate synthase subunit HisH [Trichocoleus sp. FACHB-40]MBD2002371.1 imidazole glycerol phosphate synthase subunit HisH [Trichocoleus sp. FACHB-40]